MDCGRLRSEPGENGGAVRAVRLRRPDHREAKGFGMSCQQQLTMRVIGSHQIAEVEPKAHADTLVGLL